MNVVTALHVNITSPNYFSYFKDPLLSTAELPEPTTTLAKQINVVNKRIKTTDHIHVFAPELGFIMYGKHILHHSR